MPWRCFSGSFTGWAFPATCVVCWERKPILFKPLLAFNIGLELGQLVIVAIVLSITYVAVERFPVKKHDWRLIISGIVAGYGDFANPE